MFEKNPVFEFSCSLRPIKAFHPSMLLEVDKDSLRLYLSADSKMLWFHQFCNEQGISGVVNTRFLSSEVLREVRDEQFVGGVVTPVKEYWEATVLINGNAASVATASETFLVNSYIDRDRISYTLRKRAIGAALSQAGFGVIDGFDMTPNDIQQLGIDPATVAARKTANATNVMAQPSSAPVASAPMQGNANNAATTVMQDTFFGSAAPAVEDNTAYAQAGQQPVQPTPAPAAPNGANDPLALAKQMVWPKGGTLQGKTLGEISSMINGVSKLEWIISHTTTNSDVDRQFHAAAQLVLSSIATGK